MSASPTSSPRLKPRTDSVYFDAEDVDFETLASSSRKELLKEMLDLEVICEEEYQVLLEREEEGASKDRTREVRVTIGSYAWLQTLTRALVCLCSNVPSWP